MLAYAKHGETRRTDLQILVHNPRWVVNAIDSQSSRVQNKQVPPRTDHTKLCGLKITLLTSHTHSEADCPPVHTQFITPVASSRIDSTAMRCLEEGTEVEE